MQSLPTYLPLTLALLPLLACKQQAPSAASASASSVGPAVPAPTASAVADAAPSVAPAPVAAKGPGACHNARQGFCNDFTGSSYTRAQVESACRAQNVPMIDACPSEERVGSCLTCAGDPLESWYRYYRKFPGGKAAAENQCKSLLKGQWTGD